jgi:hypothetical protein
MSDLFKNAKFKTDCLKLSGSVLPLTCEIINNKFWKPSLYVTTAEGVKAVALIINTAYCEVVIIIGYMLRHV